MGDCDISHLRRVEFYSTQFSIGPRHDRHPPTSDYVERVARGLFKPALAVIACVSGFVLPVTVGISAILIFCVTVGVVIFVPRGWQTSNVVLPIDTHSPHKPSSFTWAPASVE